MRRIPWWRVAPVVLLVAFYQLGLRTWFYQDDFGWLNVRVDIRGWADVLPALLAPKAHGNLRPLSETGFFTLFSTVFGVNPGPFRAFVLATMAANLVLLGSVVRRLGGSRGAAFWAQVFWAANCGLAVVMCWTSIYNQALCAFFLLLAFRCLLWYLETGDRRWWWGQWGAFLAGLGALETAAVYPALAAGYTWAAARKRFRRTLPLFAASAAYAALHFAVAPAAASGVYAMHPDGSMAATFQTYWRMALGPDRLAAVRPLASWVAPAAAGALTAALAVAAWRARRAWFGLLWFAVTLAPFLPLRDHVMDYYLAVPAAGLALAGGFGVAHAWRAGALGRAAAISAAALYLGFSLPASRAVVRWHYERSRLAENLVLGVAELRRAEPDRTILLAGVGTDQFYAGVADAPFRALGIERAYLAPGSAAAIAAPAEVVDKFVLPEALALGELEAGRAVVYDASGPVLRNVTGRYRSRARACWSAGTPRFIHAGDPLFAAYLGPGWGPPRDGSRVLGGRAALRIGGPRHAGERLWLGVRDGGAAAPAAAAGAAPLEPVQTVRYFGRTDFAYALPAGLAGRPEIELKLRAEAPLRVIFAEIR